MYEYRCEGCGKKFEQLRRMSEADEGLLCPVCHCNQIQRLLSTFATGGCSPSGRFT
jgi:putative FmdB family regulatory protein